MTEFKRREEARALYREGYEKNKHKILEIAMEYYDENAKEIVGDFVEAIVQDISGCAHIDDFNFGAKYHFTPSKKGNRLN